MRKVELKVGDLVKDSIGYIGLVVDIQKEIGGQAGSAPMYLISSQNGERPHWYGEGYVRRCKVISKGR